MLKTPDNLAEHHVSVRRTARYYTLGDLNRTPDRVWIVCHGYSQLADRFVRYFSVLNDGKAWIVAPEGLSRFYLNRFAAEKGDARRVGATWMTREDRLTEIDDYVGYLNTLANSVLSGLASESELYILGFSQGAATASRWVTRTDRQVGRLILWGGLLPPDLDVREYADQLTAANLTMVIGKRDEFVTRDQVAAEERRLSRAGIPYKLVRFDGGHHMSQQLLKDIDEGES